MRQEDRTVERTIAAIASRQHGVLTRAQLLVAGVSSSAVARRAAKGQLLRVHRGVYRAGHAAPSARARYMAAALACGEGALLSGRAAGHLHGLLAAPPVLVEVTAPTERRVPGLRVRRSRFPLGPDARLRHGIPVTSVERTVVDLAAALAPAALALAVHEAQVRHGLLPVSVEAVLKRRPTAAGAGALRRVLRGEERVSLSSLERHFLAVLREAGLPLPATNVLVGSRRVDCHWPERRLVVELDGYRYHHSRHAWEQDRRREREARARGLEHRRFSFGDVRGDARPMLAELRGLLLGHDPA